MENKPELQFPLSFDFKIIVSNSTAEDKTMENINEIFNKVMVPNIFADKRQSGKGKYISLTYTIMLLDRSQMNELYSEIKTLDGFVMAI